MPGQFQLSIDELVEEAKQARDLGIGGIILFGIPDEKDDQGSDALHQSGIVQQAVAEVKAAIPEILVLTDLCMCEYTGHGHCGILHEQAGITDVSNDPTLKLLGQQAVTHAQQGADIIAPSGMMDGMVQAIRSALDEAGYNHIPIMSYAAKYASSYYGPFRDAAESAPCFGDRRTYQMDPSALAEQALREVELDVQEGADMLMVKPALAYLDVVRELREEIDLPLLAYSVSGEYAMIEAAAAKGWIDRQAVVLESLLSMKRAGVDVIMTYHATEVAGWLR